MKSCGRCGLAKPLSDYSLNRLAPDGRDNRCKECVRQWYLENHVKVRAVIAAHHAAAREDARRQVETYLRAHPCVDCGETDLRTLEFDHRGAKRLDVGRMVGGAYSWATIAAEIARCDVRCANCHRRLTQQRLNSWRHLAELERAGAQSPPTTDC